MNTEERWPFDVHVGVMEIEQETRDVLQDFISRDPFGVLIEERRIIDTVRLCAIAVFNVKAKHCQSRADFSPAWLDSVVEEVQKETLELVPCILVRDKNRRLVVDSIREALERAKEQILASVTEASTKTATQRTAGDLTPHRGATDSGITAFSRHERRRGPKVNLEKVRHVSEVVAHEAARGDWKESEALRRVCIALDRANIGISKSWRNEGCEGWEQMLDYRRDLVVKAIDRELTKLRPNSGRIPAANPVSAPAQ